jgi:hypothetical protein
MSSREGSSLSLSIVESEQIAADLKEDLQRQANQAERLAHKGNAAGELERVETGAQTQGRQSTEFS